MAQPEAEQPTVLVLLGCFSAANEASGPTQTMVRNAQALSGKFQFKVVGEAVGDEPTMCWRDIGGIQRLALPYGPLIAGRIRQILLNTPHDLLICNGFFDRRMTIPTLAMRRCGLFPRTPTIVAPRGEFSPGALALKQGRKSAYMRLVRMLDLLNGVHVQATGAEELQAIKRTLPFAKSVLNGPNVRALRSLPTHNARRKGEPLRIAFLSRIDRKKNLDLALQLLARSGIEASFDIIGPITDQAYWARCEQLMASLPPTIDARHHGPIPAADVLATLAGYDILLLPTAGENYGHAIIDSLESGTPVLISDRTPWRGLAAAKAGADLPVEDEAAWIGWLRRFARMSAAELRSWRNGARRFAEGAIDPEKTAAELESCYCRAMALG